MNRRAAVNAVGAIPVARWLAVPLLSAAVFPIGLPAQEVHPAGLTRAVPGYEHAVRGEELTYHSPIPTVDKSLLVRSLDRAYDIAWESAPVPSSAVGDTVELVLMIGIDVNEEPRRFDLFVGGDSVLAFVNPVAVRKGTLSWTGRDGVSADFEVTEIDKYGDAMGYLFLRLPRGYWEPGAPVRFRVAGETAGARTWFMVFKEPIAPRIRVRNAPALLRGGAGALQTLRVDVVHLRASDRFVLASPVASLDTSVALGFNRFELAIPRADTTTSIPLTYRLGEAHGRFVAAVDPVRQFELHLIHHTHLDIGYTHHQDEVERLQWAHLDSALAYARESTARDPAARFVWHPEGVWAVESYLERRSPAERERLQEGIRRGWIALDAMFANMLTGLATEEALTRSLRPAQRLEDVTGVAIETAMLSDIPGFSWGLVPALAQHGVRYLSIGPNFGHRIGSFLDTWGDRPFWWESPSGRERVLTWVSSGGYAWFHTGLGYDRITSRLDEERVFRYVDQLIDAGYPYDIAALRYNIGSDNGPPDPTLSAAVAAWNVRYVSPRIVIGRTADLFRSFEQRHGHDLPTYRGDLTGHWEDGAASSARETAVVRRTAESLVQTEILAAILGRRLPPEAPYEAWRKVLLFEEHTWGSWNSVSEPDAEFTKAQWARKRSFADSARLLADRLHRVVVGDGTPSNASERAIAVYNTANWVRTDVVLLSESTSTAGDRVIDDSGRTVPSQRLASGELAFLAEGVPGLSGRHYRVAAGAGSPATQRTGDLVIATDRVTLAVDSGTGLITSLIDVRSGRDFVEADAEGLNQLLYVSSRDPADTHTISDVRVQRVEWGPVVHTVRVRASAPGTRGVESEIRVYAGTGRIEIVNRVDKMLVRTPEALLYRFAFDLAHPRVRVSVPWGSYEAEHEQLPGACRNYLTVERWVDLADTRGGVTIASVDAPLIQLGAVHTDAIVAGWVDSLPISGTVFSYVMNNYWETNYRAAQEGPHEWRYAVRLHGGFDAAGADRWGREVAQPLIIADVPPGRPLPGPPFSVEAARSVVTGVETAASGDALLVRLYNPSEAADTVAVRTRSQHSTVAFSDVRGGKGDRVRAPLVLAPRAFVSIRIDLDPTREP
jgi:hypothetical protein